MRVKDFVKMYRGMKCLEVEIESGKLKFLLGGANNASVKRL